ncbi:MAG: peptidoglycan editing factor PgeF [Acidobacteria bacterium]|nr:peptidoglycan editing factor PgeF [Acidobacteriota bacterium]
MSEPLTLPQPTDGFAWVQAPAGPALVCRALEPHAHHLFTTRAWALGSQVAATDADWQQVAGALDVDPRHLVRVRQVHGASVIICREGAGPANVMDADIIVSNDPSLALAIQAADCVPLLIADTQTGAVAAAHAGWRGLAARVPSAAVEALTREFGSRPEDLIAAIGPSISAERYEVGADVRARFEGARFSRAQIDAWFRPGDRPAHWYFDGWRSACDQLEAARLAPSNIHLSALCTASHADVLCSYRRDGKGAGRIAGVIRKLKLKS